MYKTKDNPLHEIVLISLILGASLGGLVFLVTFSLWNAWGMAYIALEVYGMFLSIHFLCEFINTYLYQESKVTSRSFLIYGNKGNFEFWIMQLLALWEYLAMRSHLVGRYLPQGAETMRNNRLVQYGGVFMILVGLFVRTLAMKTCGDSFSHYIATENNQHKLVTNGVYSVLRHPSYFGFWFFAIGVQLLLENWGNLLLNFIVLTKFLKVRIEFEEWFLVHRIFGDEYVEYKNRVGVWIPFLRIKMNI